QALSVVAAYLDHVFASPISVNVEVGYGEITQNGQSDPVSSGAEGGFDNNQYMSYSAFRFLYAGIAATPDQRLALANMPASNPFGGASMDISSAQLKAFGQAANPAAIDGSVGFQVNGASGVTYDFDPFQRATGSEWDFVA